MLSQTLNFLCGTLQFDSHNTVIVSAANVSLEEGADEQGSARLRRYYSTLHSEKAEFRFLKVPSGTCFRSCFDKSCKQEASITSSN